MVGQNLRYLFGNNYHPLQVYFESFPRVLTHNGPQQPSFCFGFSAVYVGILIQKVFEDKHMFRRPIDQQNVLPHGYGSKPLV